MVCTETSCFSSTGWWQRAATRQPSVDTGGALFDGQSPVFSEELRSRIGKAHFEMTALSVGLELELATIRRYRELAAAAGAPELSRFYGRLGDREETHAAAPSVSRIRCGSPAGRPPASPRSSRPAPGGD
ncbi:ferritin-like domain-containing protein [candidate division WOR-3 bacterium]|nr:ferritin-like domain-containing protein [candidate division WOR-3 bacterium]